MSALWDLVNSPAVITLVASLSLYVLNKISSKVPLAKKYSGTLIAAVKFAEKVIPDGTENKAAARLDEALKYTIRVYEAAEGKLASEEVKQQLSENLQVVHATLEANGNLAPVGVSSAGAVPAASVN